MPTQVLEIKVDSEINPVESVREYLRMMQACSKQIVSIIESMLKENPECANRKGNTDQERMERNQSEEVTNQESSIDLNRMREEFSKISEKAAEYISSLEAMSDIKKDFFEQFYQLLLQQLKWSCIGFLTHVAKNDFKGGEQASLLAQINELTRLRQSQFKVLKTRINILCKNFEVGLYKKYAKELAQVANSRHSFYQQDNSAKSSRSQQESKDQSHNTTNAVAQPGGGCCAIH